MVHFGEQWLVVNPSAGNVGGFFSERDKLQHQEPAVFNVIHEFTGVVWVSPNSKPDIWW